jgi:hypothetical protein
MSQATGHTNPLDAAYQEMSNRHGELIKALTKLRRATDAQLIMVRAGEVYNPQDIRRWMLNLEDARDIYDAARDSVRALEAQFTASEH